MGAAIGNAIITTEVEMPPDLETGAFELFVVATGITSEAFRVIIVKRDQR